jgi:hypothetical protein
VLIVISFALYKGFEAQNSAISSALDSRTVAVDEAQISRLKATFSYLPYLFMGSFVVVFGVLVAIYRFHLVEITKNEQFKLGFGRIRIAANNTSEGFQTEVRRALTENAFSFEKPRQFSKRKDLESPLPGHSASDLVTAVLNKLLDEVEFIPSKKKSDND